MSVGSSGRIVIEITPESKRKLYAELARDGLTLKEWFLRNVNEYMAAREKLLLNPSEPNSHLTLDTSTGRENSEALKGAS